jgi:hypothetical protein
MIIGGEPAVLNTRPRGTLDAFPIELDISTSFLSAVPKIAFGAILVVLGLGVLGGVPPQSQFGTIVALIFQAAPFIIILAGVYVFARGAIGLLDKRTVRIADGQVSVFGKSLLRSENWSEPLDAYDGVRWREIIVQRRMGSQGNGIIKPKVYQVLDLKHRDSGKCVPLHVSRMNDDPRPKWEHLALMLGIPAIDERDGVTRTRASEDVDKSVKELAEEGKIRADFDDGLPPPPGLDILREGDPNEPDSQILTVVIGAARYPSWLYGGLIAFGGFLITVGAYDVAALPIIFGGALIAGIYWHWRFEARNLRTVKITRSDLTYNTPNPGKQPTQGVLRHRAIESVEIGKVDERGILGRQITIATDQGEHVIGAGLSREALSWLRDLILAAVAKA